MTDKELKQRLHDAKVEGQREALEWVIKKLNGLRTPDLMDNPAECSRVRRKIEERDKKSN